MLRLYFLPSIFSIASGEHLIEWGEYVGEHFHLTDDKCQWSTGLMGDIRKETEFRLVKLFNIFRMLLFVSQRPLKFDTILISADDEIEDDTDAERIK